MKDNKNNMENEDRLNYLKKLKRQNKMLLRIICILALLVIISCIIVKVVSNTREKERNKVIEHIIERDAESARESYNGRFSLYGGIQTGANLKSLIGTLIANTNSFREESNRLQGIRFIGISIDKYSNEDSNGAIIEKNQDSDDLENCIDELKKIRNSLQNKEKYEVEFEYDDKGFIDFITIKHKQ